MKLRRIIKIKINQNEENKIYILKKKKKHETHAKHVGNRRQSRKPDG